MRKLFGSKNSKKKTFKSGKETGNAAIEKSDTTPGENIIVNSGDSPTEKFDNEQIKKIEEKPEDASKGNTSEKPGEKPAKRQRKTSWLKRPWTRRQVIYCSLMVIGVFFAAAALRVLIGDLFEDVAARSEYEQLREYSPNNPARAVQDTGPPDQDDPDEPPVENSDEDWDALEEENRSMRELSFDELAAINSDFVGWISAGSHLDYPVVRGRDNDRYINTTFTGSRNSAGAIFMDYRNARGFDEHVSILYGHYTRDGTMFSSLNQYLNSNFIRSNPNITITTRDGRTLTYRVFAAKLTDAWDIAYTVGISDTARASEVFPDAPANASRYLLLSTCTRGGSDDERILVFAAITG